MEEYNPTTDGRVLLFIYTHENRDFVVVDWLTDLGSSVLVSFKGPPLFKASLIHYNLLTVI